LGPVRPEDINPDNLPIEFKDQAGQSISLLPAHDQHWPFVFLLPSETGSEFRVSLLIGGVFASGESVPVRVLDTVPESVTKGAVESMGPSASAVLPVPGDESPTTEASDMASSQIQKQIAEALEAEDDDSGDRDHDTENQNDAESESEQLAVTLETPVDLNQENFRASVAGKPFMIRSFNGKKCLKAHSKRRSQWQTILLYFAKCNNHKSQQFTFEFSEEKQGFLIRNIHQDICLDVRYGTRERPEALIGYRCHGENNQIFSVDTLTYGSTEEFTLTAKHSDMCIEETTTSRYQRRSFSRPIQNFCTEASEQLFQLVSSSEPGH